MKKIVSLFIAVAFVTGTTGFAFAQAQTTAPAPKAEAIQGVNPMTNAPAAPAVDHPRAYTQESGVNPMTNSPPTPAVAHPMQFQRQPGVNPM